MYLKGLRLGWHMVYLVDHYEFPSGHVFVFCRRIKLFLSGIQTADEERERDVGQVPASARIPGTGEAEAEAEAGGTGRRDIHTAITILRR